MLLCVWCLNSTTHEYQVSVASDLIYKKIAIFTTFKIYNIQNIRENEKQQNKVAFAKFSHKNRNL